MRLSIVILFLFAITNEYWLDVGIASMRASNIIAVVYILSRLKKTLFILRTESKIFIVYMCIIIGIVINDLYTGADTTDIFKSIIFHIVSIINFIFFFSLFSKDELNFPKLFVIWGCSLIIYKNGGFFFDVSRLLDAAYFSSRFAAMTVYFAIGWSFFLMHKSKNFRALLILLFSFLLLYSMDTRSYGSILLVTFIMSVITIYTKINFRFFLTFLVLSIIFSIFVIFYFKLEIINIIILARLDTFSSFLYYLDTFPFGIGSGGVVDLLPYTAKISIFLGIPMEYMLTVSDSLYSSSHSFIVGALFKHGLLTALPLSYFLFNIIKLNIKMVSLKTFGNEQKLLSIFIITSITYSIFFSGYGQFLIQFPMLYALTISMNRRNEDVKL
jgi:hypothetical protein